MGKKIIGIVLSMLCCVGLFTATCLATETEGGDLSDKEQKLVDALVELTTEDFFEPSAVRVLEVGDFRDRVKYAEEDDELSQSLAAPDLVVVRLQGENKVGGTLNHYYKVCIEGYERTGDTDQSLIDSYEKQLVIKEQLVAVNGALGKSTSSDYKDYIKTKEYLMDYKAEAGDYVELEDSYEIEKDASDTFDIGKVNNALKAYWEKLGF